MSVEWQELNIGDRVRVTSWPSELSRDRMHQETVAFYDWLIETGAVLEVVNRDHLGIPYGEAHITDNGTERWETIGLNHGAIECVKAENRET